MECRRYDGSMVRVDLNPDVLAYSVGIPIMIIVVIAIIAAAVIRYGNVSEESAFKVASPILIALAGFAFISFIKWFFQTWGAFAKWFEYC